MWAVAEGGNSVKKESFFKMGRILARLCTEGNDTAERKQLMV